MANTICRQLNNDDKNFCIENNIQLIRIKYDQNIENKMNDLIKSF